MVRRLTAGAERIRTLGPTRQDCCFESTEDETRTQKWDPEFEAGSVQRRVYKFPVRGESSAPLQCRTCDRSQHEERCRRSAPASDERPCRFK
jgi:hypothetical protein